MNENIEFHCIQPIKINEILYRKFLQRRFNNKKFKKDWIKVYHDNDKSEKDKIRNILNKNNVAPIWENFLDIQTDSYFNIYVLAQNSTKFNSILIDDLCVLRDNLKIVDLPSFYLNIRESGYSLSYDEKSGVFTIIMTISLDFNLTDTSINSLDGIFSWARSKMVYDDIRGSMNTSNWAQSIKKNCKEKLAFYLNISSQELEVPPSTGYIVVSGLNNLNAITENQFNIVREKILLNNTKEDVNDLNFPEIPKLPNQSNNIIYLGWFYSTIIGLNKKNFSILFLSILLHQNTFVVLRHFYVPYIDKLLENLRYSNTFSNINLYSEYYNALQFTFRNIKQGHNRLVIKQQKWQSDLHNWVWIYWKNDYVYNEIEENLTVIENVIDKKLQSKNNTIQSTQSSILFILTLIQLFSIASIITGYFDLFKLEIPDSFGNNTKSNIKLISDNLGLIIFILSSVFIILVYRVNIISNIIRFGQFYKRKNI